VDADFLLTRGADLVVLGMRLRGFDVAAGDGLEVTAQDGARIVLCLPPQHAAEGTTANVPPDDFIPWAQLAGPSRVAYDVPGGTPVRLDAAGILDACSMLAPAATPAGPFDTAIELPWRLAFAPDIEAGAQAQHAAGVLASTDGVVGLWLSRLYGAGAAEGQGPPLGELTLLPVDAALAGREDPPGVPLALSADHRSKIVALGQAAPPRTDKVELTALGGSLAAHGEWPGFRWSHRAALGRDQAVVVVEQVRAYPFGHRGILTTTTVRDPDAALPPDRATVPPGSSLTLRQVRTLDFSEPLVQAEGPVFGRGFPFSSVELTTTSFSGLGEPEVAYSYQRPTSEQLADLEERLTQAKIDLEALAGSSPGDSALIGMTVQVAELEREIKELKALDPSYDVAVWPTTAEATRMQFPVRLRRGEQVLDLTMPLILVKDFVLEQQGLIPRYVSLEDPALAAELDEIWSASGANSVPVPGVLLDLVGSANPQPEDIQVIRGLNILGPSGGDPFVPNLGRAAAAGVDPRPAMRVDLPAVRTLLGGPELEDPAEAGTGVFFAREYLERGEEAKLLFETVSELGVDFTSRADRSGGLAALQLAADGVSRTLGPVQAEALSSPDPAKAIGPAATLLGFKLKDLIGSLPAPPKIVSDLLEGRQPVVRMEWEKVALKDSLALRAFPTKEEPTRQSLLSLKVVSDLDKVTTSCDVSDFALVFPPAGGELLKLTFAALSYAQETTRGVAAPPRVKVKGVEVEFLGPLTLLKGLQKHADIGGGAPAIRATPAGVTASFVLPLPSVTCVAFSLSNVVFRSAIEVPFGGDPVSVSLGFASRAAPFAVSVLAFSGGGYVDIRIDASGPRIEASLEFGASISVDFIVASGEVHALGGVRYLQQGGAVELTGYLRIGGSVEVLGLVSASIELIIQLAYQLDTNRLAGRAKLVLEIDLTLWSDSIEIDSGEWVLQGGDDQPVPAMMVQGEGGGELPGEALDDDLVFAAIEAQPTEAELAAWRDYRQAVGGRTGGSGDE
jgi:hypothetical protein